jgi:hypothetical protein
MKYIRPSHFNGQTITGGRRQALIDLLLEYGCIGDMKSDSFWGCIGMMDDLSFIKSLISRKDCAVSKRRVYKALCSAAYTGRIDIFKYLQTVADAHSFMPDKPKNIAELFDDAYRGLKICNEFNTRVGHCSTETEARFQSARALVEHLHTLYTIDYSDRAFNRHDYVLILASLHPAMPHLIDVHIAAGYGGESADKDEENTALSVASDPVVIRKLLDVGAPVNQRRACSSLKASCERGCVDSVKMLLEAGASCGEDSDRHTPLEYTMSAQCIQSKVDDKVKIVDMLLDSGIVSYVGYLSEEYGEIEYEDVLGHVKNAVDTLMKCSEKRGVSGEFSQNGITYGVDEIRKHIFEKFPGLTAYFGDEAPR